jgi:hypothetical protein
MNKASGDMVFGRGMKKASGAGRIGFFVLFIGFLIVATFIWAACASRPEMVIADKNISPANLRDGMGQKVILSSHFPAEKYVKQYRYLLCSAEGAKLDGKKYLKKFPEDAVLKTSIGKGEEYLRIFTDYLPDASDGLVESVERAKWLKIRSR